jgi:hypothetical protein
VAKYIGVVAGLMLAVMVVGTALAEGYWTSFGGGGVLLMGGGRMAFR